MRLIHYISPSPYARKPSHGDLKRNQTKRMAAERVARLKYSIRQKKKNSIPKTFSFLHVLLHCNAVFSGLISVSNGNCFFSRVSCPNSSLESTGNYRRRRRPRKTSLETRVIDIWRFCRARNIMHRV